MKANTVWRVAKGIIALRAIKKNAVKFTNNAGRFAKSAYKNAAVPAAEKAINSVKSIDWDGIYNAGLKNVRFVLKQSDKKITQAVKFYKLKERKFLRLAFVKSFKKSATVSAVATSKFFVKNVPAVKNAVVDFSNAQFTAAEKWVNVQYPKVEKFVNKNYPVVKSWAIAQLPRLEALLIGTVAARAQNLARA